tara:strand:- start:520 stop:723 length:204 start_codon:yes stop_codon:yes gene_type:complete
MEDRTYNITCVSQSGNVVTLVFSNINDQLNAWKKVRKAGYRELDSFIGYTAKCTRENLTETLELHNK